METKTMPIKVFQKKLKRKLGNNGQSSIEFMLVLPWFLMLTFAIMLFAFRVVFAEMTLYSVFYGGRVATVGGSSSAVESAAQSVLPGSQINVSKVDGIKVKGKYQVNPLIKKSEMESLNSPLSETEIFKKEIKFPLFVTCTSASANEDNPVGNGSGLCF